MKRLSRIFAIPLGPVLLVQGRRLRRTIPKLPDAALPWDGSLAGPRPVRLLVLGDSTASGVGAESQLKATAGRFDLVFLTIGANDALGLRSRDSFSRDVRTLVDRLRDVNPEALILVLLMPRFDRFASLPHPVKWNLALHAASLDDGARTAVSGMPGIFAIPKPSPYTPEFWAADGFHPSAEGYRQWIEFAMECVPNELLDAFLS